MSDRIKGFCPSCGKPGESGTPCPQKVCGRRKYHRIPAVYAPEAPDEVLDPLVGLMAGDSLMVRPIGAGSFGRVYLALQQPLGMKVAVKLLNLEFTPESIVDAMEAKFRSEAEALSKIQHPNIVGLLKYGRSQGRSYLVTELVEGGITLQRETARRAENGRLFTPDELSAFFRQVLDGLKAAHNAGIIHRDIKPENLMIQQREGYPNMVRILDFGLAKFIDAGDSTSATAGTPEYMAPEQLARKRLGPWTDLYAVGTIAFELMTGRKPFAAANIKETFLLKVSRSYDPLSRLKDMALPGDLTRFLERALHREVDGRYQNTEAFGAGVGRALSAWTKSGLHEDAGISYRELLSEATFMQLEAVTEPEATNPGGSSEEQSEEAFRRWLDREQRRLAGRGDDFEEEG